MKQGTARCFGHQSRPVRTDFAKLSRVPDTSRTSHVTSRLLSLFLSDGMSQMRLVCAQFISLIDSHPIMRALLPLSPRNLRTTSSRVFHLAAQTNGFRMAQRGITSRIDVGFPRSVVFRRSPIRVLSTLLPLCLGGRVLETLRRSTTDRLTTQVATVGGTDSGTGRLTGALGLACGGTHRTTVARRVLRMISKTGTLN